MLFLHMTEDSARLDITTNGYSRGVGMSRCISTCESSNFMLPQTSNFWLPDTESMKTPEKSLQTEIEHGSFTVIMLSLTVGLGKVATMCCTKEDLPYSSTTTSWIRCLLFFSLLRSAIQSSCGCAAMQQSCLSFLLIWHPLRPVSPDVELASILYPVHSF